MLTSRLRCPQASQLTVLALLAGTLATASGAAAQELQDLKKPATPLVLQSQGSFTVGALSLKDAVLMGHSESGRAPLEAALIDASGIRGMIVMEPPGGCGTKYTDQQIATLAPLPILIVFGDHLTVEPRNWRRAFENCEAFIARINAATGNAKMLYPPDLRIHGNSHMIMQDKNNLEIADLILDWIDRNVGTKVTSF